METSELIRRASKRDISTYDNLSLYFDTVRLETDFEKARPHYERIYDIAAQQKVKLALTDQQTAIKFYELAKKAALMLAPQLFHYYLLYVEWDREPQKKFYVPRMNVLKPVVDALQRLEERKLKRLTISMPPRTGKSTLGMFFMSWVAGRHPLGSSALTGYSDTLTKTFFDEILGIITDPEYLWADVFPTSQIKNISRENASVCLDKKRRFATITCRGISASWTGAINISEILYCDDLIEDLEEALNEKRLDAKYAAYANQTKDRKTNDAVELHIGTRWAVRDVIGRLQEQYADDPHSEFMVLPALDENGKSNFEYPYGVGFSAEYYLDMKASIDPCTWSCKYMGDPYVREGLLFERDELNYYNGVLPDGECDIMSVVDVAWDGGDSLSAPIIYWFGDTGYVHDWVFSTGDKSVTQPLVCAAYARNNVAIASLGADSQDIDYKLSSLTADKIALMDEKTARSAIAQIQDSYNSAVEKMSSTKNSALSSQKIRQAQLEALDVDTNSSINEGLLKGIETEYERRVNELSNQTLDVVNMLEQRVKNSSSDAGTQALQDLYNRANKSIYDGAENFGDVITNAANQAGATLTYAGAWWRTAFGGGKDVNQTLRDDYEQRNGVSDIKSDIENLKSDIEATVTTNVSREMKSQSPAVSVGYAREAVSSAYSEAAANRAEEC